MRRALMLVILLAVVPGLASAATYYVATNGDDARSCSTATNINTPKKTIVSGTPCLSAGATLLIRGGTYTSKSNSIPSGTSWTNAVTIAGYPGETVVLQVGHTNRWFLQTGQRYIVFKNMVWDGFGYEGGYSSTTAGAEFIKFEDLEVKNAHGTGIFANVGADNWWLRVYIHETNAVAPHISGLSHAVYAKADRGIVEDSRFDRNGAGYDLHIKAKDDGSAPQPDNWIVRRNTFSRTGAAMYFQGSGHKIFNNILYKQQCEGIRSWASGSRLEQNTFYAIKNTSLGASQWEGKDCGDPTKRGDTSGTTNMTVKNNISYGSGYSTPLKGGGQANNMVGTNPLFVNVSGNDYHLQSGSPAINNCPRLSDITDDIDRNARPGSGNYDCGADEQGGVTPPVDPEQPPVTLGPLIGHWNFNNAGTDDSGSGNGCTLTGATYTTTDPLEGTHSLLADATTERADCGLNGFALSAFTLQALVKPTAFTGVQYIIGHTTSPCCGNRIYLNADASGALNIRLGAEAAVVLPFTLSTTLKNYVALAVSGSSWTAYAAVEGSALSQVGAGSFAASGLTQLAPTLCVGNIACISGAGSQPINGRIDAVRVYNTVRTQAQIQTDCAGVMSCTQATEPTYQPVDLNTCTNDAATGRTWTATLVQTPVDPVFCDDPANRELTYDGIDAAITSCQVTNGPSSSTLTYVAASPPASAGVAVVMTNHVPVTADVATCTNNFSPAAEGASLDVVAFWGRPVGLDFMASWEFVPNDPIALPSPGVKEVRVALKNVGGATSAELDPVLYCARDCPVGGCADVALTRVTDRVDGVCTNPLALCYYNDPTMVAHDTPTSPSITTWQGVGTFGGGRFKTREASGYTQTIAPGAQLEMAYAVAVADGITKDTVFTCEPRPYSGVALGAVTTPAVLKVVRPYVLR